LSIEKAGTCNPAQLFGLAASAVVPQRRMPSPVAMWASLKARTEGASAQRGPWQRLAAALLLEQQLITH